jgi:glycosyltransferase involved in cell wall biosynthesis
MSEQLKLSVRLMTYNHANYIRQALDGVFAQITNFKFEVVVGDDFSIDANLDIIGTYNSTNTIELRVLDRPKHGEYWQARQTRGRLYNFQNILENCQGEYIALLDGDDYWTDPHKLQKQVDFLDQNKEYAISFHTVTKLNETTGIAALDEPDVDGHRMDIRQLAHGNIIETCSCVYRNFGIPGDLFLRSNVGDYALHMFTAQHGDIHFMKDNMAVYRIHEKGVWSKIDNDVKLNRIKQNLWVLSSYFVKRRPLVALIIFKRLIRIMSVIFYHSLKDISQKR